MPLVGPERGRKIERGLLLCKKKLGKEAFFIDVKLVNDDSFKGCDGNMGYFFVDNAQVLSSMKLLPYGSKFSGAKIFAI
jgi:hypothetical protein